MSMTPQADDPHGLSRRQRHLDPSGLVGRITPVIVLEDVYLAQHVLRAEDHRLSRASRRSFSLVLEQALGGQNPYVDTGLVGRDRELALLRRRFVDAVGGRGGVLLVAGEPGIGKTALVAVFAAEAAGRGTPVLVGRAVADEGAPELWPWRRMFDAAGLDLLDPRSAGPDPVAARFQVVDRAVRSMCTAAEREGMLVVLEDLHWADEASLSMLRHLAGEVTDARLVVVGTYRDPDGPEGIPASLARLCAVSTVETLRLGPLGVPDVAAYLAGLGDTDPSWPPHVHERSGGNPL